MAELLKDIYSHDTLLRIGTQFSQFYKDFNIDQFLTDVTADNWADLTLTQRHTRLATCVYNNISLPYEQLSEILIAMTPQCQGFAYIFMPKIIELYGLNDIEISLNALEVLTAGSSAEFAIRPFLQVDFDYTYHIILQWTQSDNEHHRRLASEGLRIGLPWAKKLPILNDNIDKILYVLTQLRNDPSLYVRKSVANNLNDLSKCYPDLVIDTFKKWIGESTYTDWIIKKGARTLIKLGDTQILELLNYNDTITAQNVTFQINPPIVTTNATSTFNYELTVHTCKTSKVRISLVIDFVKSNGNISSKLFFIKDVIISKDTKLSGKKTYTWKDMTTRKHYKGTHVIHLLVNSVEVAKNKVEFV